MADIRRRTFLRTSAIALTVGVAGCGGDGGGGDGGDGGGTATPTATPTAASTDTAMASPTDTATASPTATPTEGATPTDSSDPYDSPTPGTTASGTATPTATPTPTATATPTDADGVVEFTLTNVGASAWEVTEGADEVAPGGGENPTLQLSVGTRYEITNDGWSVHPLAFRDANDNALLSQSGSGQYEDDGAVDWVDDGGSLAFTLTADLASDLDDYVCTVHAAMNGQVETS